MSSTKPKRHSNSHKTKLRASCDGCYLTKIKCSKARPMCSRCLTYGIDCTYSPSSRSGRVKKDPESDTSRNSYQPYPPSQMQDQLHGETNQDLRPSFLYIPPANLPDSESSFRWNTVTVAPDLGQPLDLYPIFDGESVCSEVAMVTASSSIDHFDTSLSWTNTETPTMKAAYSLPENNMLSLTSELMYSSPNMSWSQSPDNQLDFMPYDTPALHVTPSHSPTTSISAFIPSNCNCNESFHQDPGVFHSHSCPNFRQAF